MSFSSMDGLLSAGDTTLQKLAARSAELQGLKRRIDPLVPATLRPYLHVTDLHHGTLTLTVTDAARATRARLLGPTIIGALKTGPEPSIKRVKVRVMRSADTASRPEAQPHRRNPISRETASLLQTAAGDADDALARSLRRLASSASSRDEA